MVSVRKLSFILALIILGTLLACTDGGGSDGPTINLSAEPITISFGGSSTLTWQVSGVEPITLSLEPDVGVDLVSPLTVSPTETTTYTLTATNAEGSSSERVTITVTDVPTITIESFTATPPAGPAPLAVAFAWQLAGDGPAGCSLNPGDGSEMQRFEDCTSSQQVNYTYSQVGEYTAVLELASGQTAQATVTVSGLPSVTSFNVTPNTGTVPLETTFTWSIAASEAVACTLDVGDGSALQNFGDCRSSQQASHTYTQSGTFTARLSLASGASQSVTVTASPDPDTTDTVLVGGFVDEQSRNVIVIMTDDGPKPKRASLNRLNAAIAKVDASLGVAADVPAIRGFNKAVLGLLQADQPEDEDATGATRLFNFVSEFIVAVTSEGDVVAASPLNRITEDDDNSRLRFDLNVPVEQDVALLLAEPDGQGGWVCKGLLEYQTLQQQRTVASGQTLYRFSAELAGNETPLNTGRFQFNELTANLASRTAVTSTNVMAEDLPDGAVQDAILAMDDAPEFMDGSYAFCGNPNVVETNVNATINWLSESCNPFTTPPNASPDLALGEAALYDFGIALLLETITEEDDDGNMVARNRLVGSAPIDPQGNVQLRVVRNALENLNASLFFTDVGYYDNDKRRFPLTPSYQFEGSATASAMSVAELSLQQDGPEQIDLGRLTGRMAYISGRTFARSGDESGNSTVIMALDDEQASFNIAQADAGGFYEIFIPADEEDYIFYGEDQNDEFFGLVGNNVNGNRYEVRRGVVIEENISLSIPFDDDFFNNPPTINNLNDQAVLLDGQGVELSADITDPDGDAFTVLWEVITQPLLSTISINNPTEDTATFRPAREGIYVFRLTVSDGLAQVTRRVEVSAADNVVGFVNAPEDAPLLEDDTQVLMLERDSTNLALALRVILELAESSTVNAADILLAPTTPLSDSQYEVVFPAGQATINVNITALDDGLIEPAETLVLALVDEEDDNNYAVAEDDTTGNPKQASFELLD
ncbi:MAG: hypothetical protein AAF267_02030 [Deinococcota bacterium]